MTATCVTKIKLRVFECVVVVFLFVTFLSDTGVASAFQPMNCPTPLIKFEKVIGLRPPADFPRSLLHRSNNELQPITEECLKKCRENSHCISFVLSFNTSECFWYRSHVAGFQEFDNVIDTNVAWFSKICLDVPRNCKKLWIFDRVPGAILIGNDAKTIPERVSRRNCQQICLDETNFRCKSVKFLIEDGRNAGINLTTTETVGTCVLSDTDRHLSPNSYRVSSYDEEYFENQCTDEATTNEFCSYDEFPNSVLGHTDVVYINRTKEDCRSLCERFQEFHCRGYSTIPAGAESKILLYTNQIYSCLLHSEDSKLHGPKLLLGVEGAAFYERAPCLNVSLSCTEKHMMVRYQPEDYFRGRMYLSGYSEQLECSAEGNGNEPTILIIPLFSNKCGIFEAHSVGFQNRSLMTGTLVLQHNALIQTQGDRLIKIGCFFDNDTKITLGTGVNVKTDGSSLGSTTIINSSSIHPTVELRIEDLHDHNNVLDTQIGQELQLIIEIKPAVVPYDIWAGHLVAMTENGQDSILLLDDNGCPTNLNIFSGLTRKSNGAVSKQLVANFQAFKFTTSPVVKFNVIVHFCAVECPIVICGDTSSPNRVERSTKTKIETRSGEIHDYITDVNGKGANASEEMPLEYILVVRQSPVTPDKLIYGDNNKVLVAGYDFVTHEVCIDYNLIIGVVILWVSLQVIMVVACLLLIRRYKKFYDMACGRQSLEELHKNFGLGFSNLENRRVRWADRRLNDL